MAQNYKITLLLLYDTLWYVEAKTLIAPKMIMSDFEAAVVNNEDTSDDDEYENETEDEDAELILSILS